MLRPSSRFARKWRRLSSWAGQPRRRGLSDDEQDDDDDGGGEAGEGGAGYDTRLYLSDAEAAAAAGAEMERRVRAQQQQLEAQGLKLAAYGEVRDTVRDRLLPIPAPPPAGIVPRLGLAAESGAIELASAPAAKGSTRSLPAISEAPGSPQSPGGG